MQKWECDKCGKIVGDMECYEVFSFSKNKKVDLCRSCHDKLDKAIKKADADFFKKKGE